MIEIFFFSFLVEIFVLIYVEIFSKKLKDILGTCYA